MGDNGFDSDSHLVALMQRDVVLFILRTTDENMLKHIKKMIKRHQKIYTCLQNSKIGDAYLCVSSAVRIYFIHFSNTQYRHILDQSRSFSPRLRHALKLVQIGRHRSSGKDIRWPLRSD